jgi:PAS domain S-box-containing protein
MSHSDKTRDQLLLELEELDGAWRRVQGELSEQKQLFRLLVENSLGLMCSHDLDGVLLSINPAAAQSLGYRPEDGIGHNLREFLAPAVRHLFDHYLDRIRRERSDSGLLRLTASDGSERVWLYRNILYEEPGLPPCVLGHAQDITERVRAENALKQANDELAQRVAERTAELERSNWQLRLSEARFRALAEHATDLVAIMESDGCYQYVSPAYRRVLGYDVDDLLGRPAFDLVHPEDRPRATEAFAAALREPAGLTRPPLELRVRHADESWRVLEVTAYNRLHDPAVRGVIINAHDITRRQRAEEEGARLLQQEQEAREQAELAVRVRDEFLTAAAHDLRTPLTVITGHIDMILRDLARVDSVSADWLQWRLKAVEQAGTRMMATVEDLTDAALVQIGQTLPLALDNVDIGALITSAVSATLPSLLPDPSRVVVEVVDELRIVGDRARLERVLDNIIGNGLKYSPLGAPLHIRVQRHDHWAVISVRDQGVGIPSDELPHIFTHFYRASTASGVPGMGLGLAGARASVEQHGGRISIESALGEGTTVSVYLPLARSAEHIMQTRQ